MAVALPDNGCLNHTISLSRLITEGSDTPWPKFEILGLSDRDHRVYILAISECAIGVFSGSPLFTNSWKLISKFLPTGIAKIDFEFDEEFHSSFPKAFSCAFDKIGLIFTVYTDEDIAEHVMLHHIFAILDLTTYQWQSRIFTWEDQQPFTELFHTRIGWLAYDGFFGGTLSVYLFSLDPTEPCPLYITRPPPQDDTIGNYENDDFDSSFFISKDFIYFLPFFHEANNQRFMLACHLESEELTWKRFDFGSAIRRNRNDQFGNTWGSLPLIKANICRCNGNEPLDNSCADCQERHSDPLYDDPLNLQKIYTFELDSATKHANFHKYGQFWDNRRLVQGYICDVGYDGIGPGFVQSATISKSKFLSLTQSKENYYDRKLFLHTASFRNVPSLKELGSLVVVKQLSKKTQVTVHGGLTLSAWNGGPSDEIKRELGINAVFDFGEIQP